MKYKCLVLDHDDTVVKSTPTIHYPSFIRAMKELRPEVKPYTLEEFITHCFNPGFHALCSDILQFSDSESLRQQEIWNHYTNNVIPEFYEGFGDLIKSFKGLGGYICVVSHSRSDRILRDYQHTLGIEPDLIFGWEYEEHQRKPSPYPLNAIMEHFNLDKRDLIVVDDLKPGLDMAKSCDIDFACAGWSHMIPTIKDYMRTESDYYFEDIKELRNIVL